MNQRLKSPRDVIATSHVLSAPNETARSRSKFSDQIKRQVTKRINFGES